jgi:hypothetical protein
MQKNTIENLKNLFVYSSDYVVITDYDFKILWHNRTDNIFLFSGSECSDFFSDEPKPLKSGEYSIKHNNLIFSCRVINCPDCENGVYVFQTDGEDVMFSFIKCPGISQFLMNQAGAVRQAVTGITFSSNMLHKVLEESDLYTDYKYLDITMGNCYRLLKTVINTTELIRYTDGSLKSEKVDVSAVMNEFVKKCTELMGENIEVQLEAQNGLYITADEERFVACLLSLTVLVNGKNPENNIILFKAEKIGDAVVVTAKTDRNGTELNGKVFSRSPGLYDGDEVDSDLLVVSRFCRTFNGTLFVSDAPDNTKVYGMKFQFCDDVGPAVELNSSVRPYTEDKFSKYHIALSEIADIFYYT